MDGYFRTASEVSSVGCTSEFMVDAYDSEVNSIVKLDPLETINLLI